MSVTSYRVRGRSSRTKNHVFVLTACAATVAHQGMIQLLPHHGSDEDVLTTANVLGRFLADESVEDQ